MKTKFLTTTDGETFYLFNTELFWVNWNLTHNNECKPIGWVPVEQLFTYYGVVREDIIEFEGETIRFRYF